MTLPQKYTDAAPAMSSAATASGTDYKALVVVTLMGGCDAHGFVIPTGAGYDQVSATRGVYAPTQPTPLTNQVCGFNVNCTGLTTLFNAGRLSIVANVGVLAEPLSPAMWTQHNTYPYNIQYRMPLALMSHVDLLEHWNTLEPENPFADTGWAGRLVELLAAYNGMPTVSPGISLYGNVRLLDGYDFKQYRMSPTGPIKLTDAANYPAGLVTAFSNFSTEPVTSFANVHEKELQALVIKAQNVSGAISTAIAAYTPATVFPNTILGNQLKMVARLIAQRSTFGHRRDVFYVAMPGFDTHDSTTGGSFPTLMTDLSAALTAFDTEMGSLNGVDVRNNVTTFTTSDFGRTLVCNASGGSDHGWGGHHVVMGGAIRGGKVFTKANALDTTVIESGVFPNVALGGPNDIGQGRLLPQIGSDEYIASILKWFGVPNATVNGVNPMHLAVPNLSRFKTPDLGIFA